MICIAISSPFIKLSRHSALQYFSLLPIVIGIGVASNSEILSTPSDSYTSRKTLMPSLIYSLRSTGAAASSAVPSLRAAIRRMRRESVERELEGCQMVAGLWCHSLTVRQIQCLRGALPKSAKFIIAKNTLVGKSTEGTSWESIRSCARGMNAWLFVRSEDDVSAALKACRDFQRQWKLDLNDFTGAVFQGHLYGPQDFGVLEATPAKADSNAYLLGSLQLPAASLIGLLQASQESVSSADAAIPPDATADVTAAAASAAN